MTKDEAQKLADLMVTADDGCPTCIAALVDVANGLFDDWAWEYNKDDDRVEVTERDE